MVIRKMGKTKITLRIQKAGKFVQKEITQKEICALFDLQFMLDETWDKLKLNHIDKDLANFFNKISFLDDAMHGNQYYHMNDDGKFKPCKKKTYIHGRPRWQKIKTDS